MTSLAGGPVSAGAAEAEVARRSPWATMRAYVALTKPRIIELLLVTTVPAMVLAARGLPPLGVAVATLAGGTLAAGSANALNCYVDRDVDALMRRTRRRPLARDQVSPHGALVFGVLLGLVALAVMAGWTNALAAWLTAAAILFYVFVYSIGLKRHTPENIVWGGAAGCMPVLIGWAAVTGSLALAPFVLFLVVFFWTPPHFWALAMRYREDYAAAGIPMLPVVATDGVVTGRILRFTAYTVAASIALWPVGGTGWLYPAVAAALGAAFLVEAYRLYAAAGRGVRGAPLHSMRLFHLSNTYLTLLFVALAVDTLLLR